MTIKAVAWDIDGTLIDSEPLHHRALVVGTLEFGVDLSDLPESAFRGVHMQDVWAAIRPRLPSDTDARQWLDAIHTHYAAATHRLAPMVGAVEATAEIASLGLIQVCVSNSDRVIVDANVAALGIGDRLAFTLAINDVGHGKPDPEPYLTAAANLDLVPHDVIAVEDSITGAQAARAAGMIVVGYHGERVPFADLDDVVANHSEFVAIITQRLRTQGHQPLRHHLEPQASSSPPSEKAGLHTGHTGQSSSSKEMS
ncbi:HAD superfamily hydrolase (TIGR01509 family) [Mesorhizobium shonense]|uniref:HAD superfamily hydrolase (TIGR01509 family) n=1 Tax=Mesorhizobium shonense TaxID=1209948 RepID=A0ABV2HL91_9HYPH